LKNYTELYKSSFKLIPSNNYPLISQINKQGAETNPEDLRQFLILWMKKIVSNTFIYYFYY